MKKIIVLTHLLLVGVLCSCDKPVPKQVMIELSDVSSPVSIHTAKQLEFINADDPDALVDADSVSYGRKSNSFPNKVKITWTETNDINQEANGYQFLINEKGKDLVNYHLPNVKEIELTNFKLETNYEYEVVSVHGSRDNYPFGSDKKEFAVSDVAPRNLYIEGVENCRDLGGWDIGEGRVYKQGLIYRTAQFNYGGGLNSYKSEPTESGLFELTSNLKIRTDIDLRKTVAFNDEDEVNGITSSPLGNDVNYVSCPMIYGNQNIFTVEENKPSIRLFFETLGQERNYPIAFHCMRGTDRTGALAYVLGALVGMNEKDLMLDYLFSDLANIGTPVRKSTISGQDFYIQGILESEGATLSEKTKNYLVNTVNVSKTLLNKIIDILTD